VYTQFFGITKRHTPPTANFNQNYMLKINRLSPRSASFTYSYKKKPYKAVSKKR
jgi:hypothetical protein